MTSKDMGKLMNGSQWDTVMRPPRASRPAYPWWTRRAIRRRFESIIEHIDTATRCRPCMTADDHRPCYDVLCHCECSR